MTADELGKILDELGQRLGPTGQHVFQLAVRQIIIEGIIGLIAGVVLVVLSVELWRKGKTWILSRETNSYSDDALDKGMPIGFMSLGLAFPFGFGLFLVYGALTTLTNPEYAALRDILSRIVK